MNRFFRSPPRVFAIAGALLFLLALWQARQPSSNFMANTKSLARLEIGTAPVYVERDGRRLEVKEAMALHRFETVETGPGGNAILDFPSGERLRISENSVVFADQDSGRPLLVIKAGDIWADRIVARAQSVIISREGSRRPLAVDPKARTAKTRKASEAPTAVNRPGKLIDRILAAEKKAAMPSLAPESIRTTLAGQKNLFFRCYGQLLQRTPGVSGEASLAFTIERTGRVTSPEISSSNLQDPEFRRCLTEALRRVSFKSFAGEPVQALFPLRFE